LYQLKHIPVKEIRIHPQEDFTFGLTRLKLPFRILNMTLEEILEEWDTDSRIDPLDLGNEVLRLTNLHGKYLRLLAIEGRELRELEGRLKQLVHLKTEWYKGNLNGTEELKKLGWEPHLKNVLNPDMQRHIDADREVIRLTRSVGEQREKKEVLSSILKEVFSRSFNIRAAIDWRKFEAGA
jgi:hypothetical protein